MPRLTILPDTLAFTIMLAGIAALPPLLIDMNLPALIDIERAFDLAEGQGGLTISMFLLGFSLAPAIGGPLSDRFGRKPLLLIALGVITAAALACALTTSFRHLIIFRMIKGVACGFCMLMPLAIIRDCLDGSAVRRQHARIMLTVGLAPLLAPILGGWVMAAWNWRGIYATQTALGVLEFAVVALAFTESLDHSRRRTLRPSHLLGAYRSLLGNRKYLGHALLVAFCFGCMFSYISGSPGLFIGMLHLSRQTYSFIFALTAFGLMSGSYLSGRLARREARPRAVITVGLGGLVLGVAAAVALSLTETVLLWAMVPAVFVVMLCFALISPNAMSEALDPVAHIAGTASGAANALQMLVGSGASAAVSVLAAVFDPALAMTGAMACSALLATGLYFGLGLRNS